MRQFGKTTRMLIDRSAWFPLVQSTTERWQSGWMHRSWKPARWRHLPGFESLSLRHLSHYSMSSHISFWGWVYIPLTSLNSCDFTAIHPVSGLIYGFIYRVENLQCSHLSSPIRPKALHNPTIREKHQQEREKVCLGNSAFNASHDAVSNFW